MGDANGGLHFIYVLAAGAARAVGVDLQFIGLDDDLGRLVGLGHDRDRRGRRVDPPRGLGGGDALDPVHPGLVLELAVDGAPAHLQHRLLEPAAAGAIG